MILLLVTLILSLMAALWMMPKLIKGLKEHNMVVPDRYKKGQPEVPSKGGMILLFSCSFMITIIPVLIYVSRQTLNNIIHMDFLNTPYLEEMNYFIALVLLAYGTFGMFDDYLDMGRPIKIFLPFIFSAPIILLLSPDHLHIPLYGDFDLSQTFLWIFTYKLAYRFLIIPVYIMVVANLVNMHSGYNGLATGTSLIVLSALVGKSFVEGYSGDIVTIGAFLGGLIALWIYNRYPAKIFEGNTGALMIGAAIGITIVVKGYLLAGFVMLLPHTVNFLMYVYWRIRRLMAPKDPTWQHVKWGILRKDGTIKVPNVLTLKWVLPYHFRMTEKQATYWMYGLTAVFAAIGFFIPY